VTPPDGTQSLRISELLAVPTPAPERTQRPRLPSLPAIFDGRNPWAHSVL
jgi:hypothetical protein